MIQVERIDFSAFKGLVLTKVFTINEVVNGVVQLYDMTGKAVTLILYDRSDIPVVLYQIVGAVGVGVVSFSFTNVQTDLALIADYQIIETPDILLGYGSANFKLAQDFMPFKEIVLNESPLGIIIPDSYISLKSIEWRLFLQKAISPEISDFDVQDEAAWPILVNILIAKLIVYDYLLRGMRSALANDGVKQVQTGPTTVEYFDPLDSLGKLYIANKGGISPILAIARDACQLATRLRIYLPMCDNMLKEATIPLKVGRPDLLTLPQLLLKDFGNDH